MPLLHLSGFLRLYHQYCFSWFKRNERKRSEAKRRKRNYTLLCSFKRHTCKFIFSHRKFKLTSLINLLSSRANFAQEQILISTLLSAKNEILCLALFGQSNCHFSVLNYIIHTFYLSLNLFNSPHLCHSLLPEVLNCMWWALDNFTKTSIVILACFMD